MGIAKIPYSELAPMTLRQIWNAIEPELQHRKNQGEMLKHQNILSAELTTAIINTLRKTAHPDNPLIERTDLYRLPDEAGNEVSDEQLKKAQEKLAETARRRREEMAQ